MQISKDDASAAQVSLSAVGAVPEAEPSCGATTHGRWGSGSHRVVAGVSHQGRVSGGLPLLAMARCVATERPDLAWAVRNASAASAGGDLAAISGTGSPRGGFELVSDRGGVTLAPLLVATEDTVPPPGGFSFQVRRSGQSDMHQGTLCRSLEPLTACDVCRIFLATLPGF